MKLIKFSVNHPVSVFMFTLAAIIFGFISYSKLSLNLLPEISYPTLTIKTEYSGTAPAEIEHTITKPIEEAVGVVDGVVRISSVSRAELSEVTIEFDWKTNMDFATLKVREKLDLVNLPLDAKKPIILRYDPNTEPVLKIGIIGTPSLSRIRYYSDTDIKQAIESIEGVAALSISGGYEDEIHIDIDEKKLSLLNIPISTVVSRLAQENVNLSAGILKQRGNQYLVRTVNEFKTVDEIKEIIVEKRENIPIKLGSLAKVYRGYKERKVISKINGKECIEAAVYRAADANTVKVSDEVINRLNKLKKDYFKQKGLDYFIITNQAKFIKNTINEVIFTAIIGGLLAVLVLLYFLKNIRSTLIISTAIPVSVIITFFFMYSSGISLNIISLGGLALGIGMLVDNSIVVLEAIQRYRERGVELFKSVLDGTGEVAGAVTASTFTTVAVFFPIVFIEGIAGQLFRDMALTVTYSLLASLIVSLTLVPMLSTVFVRKKKNNKKRIESLLKTIFKPLDKIYDKFFNLYEDFQHYTFNKKKLIFIVVIVLFIISIFLTKFMGKELIPVISQGEFIVNVEFKPGINLNKNEKVISLISNRINKIEEVSSVYELIGKGSRGGVSFQEERENLSELTIRLKKGILGKSEEKVMEKVRNIVKEYSEIKAKVYKPRLFSFKAPIEVVISGNDINILKRLSDDLYNRMKKIKGLIDVKSSMEQGYPEIKIIFNRSILSSQNITIKDIGEQLRQKIEGEVATRFIEREREVDIRVRLSERYRNRINKISNLGIRNGYNIVVPLKALAKIEIGEGPAEIRRLYQQKVAIISANISNTDLETAGKNILKEIDTMNKPVDYRIYLSGQSQEKDVAFNSMIFAILLAVFLVYLVMASQFESFIKPFIIMFTIPLGIIGIVVALLISSLAINVIVLIGLVIMAGIVVNNAIVLVDYASQLQEKGMKKNEAIKTAAKVRWRPILMTTITTVLGLLPMAIDFNEGFEIRIPIAVTLIGGLIFGTFLTLVFIPLVYSIVVKEKE